MTDSEVVRQSHDRMNKTLREMSIRLEEAQRQIERNRSIERGYPVVSSFPTGVSDGFIVYHTLSRRMHMYDGTTWFSLADIGSYISAMQSIIGLIGFWPMNSFDTINADIYDYSGQGRTLIQTGITLNVLNDRVTYTAFNGTTSYLARADEAGLDVSTAMTVGCWVKLNTTGTQVIMNKNGAGGQYGWELAFITTSGFRFAISGDGSVTKTVVSSTPSPSTTAWYHIVARFFTGTEIDIFVNGVKTINTTAIPAVIFNSNAAFNIGRASVGGVFLNGSVAFPFISRTSLTDSYINALYEEGRPLFT